MYDHRRLFIRISETLERHPSASLAELAAALHVHPHTVAAVIGEQAGTNFTDWRTGRRTAMSCALLRTRAELSIKEVASAVGFGSTSAFDRFLRRTCGRSPSECRLAIEPAEGTSTPCGGEALRAEAVARPGQRIGAPVNAHPDAP